MAVDLVTGYAGKPHVSAADTGAFNAGVIGSGKYVLNMWDNFAYELISNNEIKIKSGSLVNQGRNINIANKDAETLTIQTGENGLKRYDIVAMRYQRDKKTQIETASLVIVKGTPSENPKDPEIQSGNILNSDYTDDYALYRIKLNGILVEGVEQLFEVLTPLAEVPDLLDSITSKMLNKVYPVGAVYLSIGNISPTILFGGTWEKIEGRYILAASNSDKAGSTGGNEKVTLTQENLPVHTHTGAKHTHVIPAHAHTIAQHSHNASCGSAGTHSHCGYYRSDSKSGGSQHRQGSKATHNGLTEGKITQDAGSHTHPIDIKAGGPTKTQTDGECITKEAMGITGTAGDGMPFTIKPPYIAVNMWIRTA